MIKIVSPNNTTKLHNDSYALVSDLIKGSNFSMPCGGKGTCLKCKVILKGDTNKITEIEKNALAKEEIEKGVRLACFSEIKSGEIIIDDNFIFKGAEDKELNLPLDITLSEDYAVSIDIGTTTVAGCLYNVKANKKEKELLENNVLISFGGDVISRIEYSVKNGVDKLEELLVNQVDKMISSLLGDKKARITVTGNTVMLNILNGNSISKMGMYPYTPESLFGKETKIKERKVYLPKCISAFIGADVLCALVASGISLNEKALLIDMGTNGEIALKNGNNILCVSVAAGPAFEGVGISMGMGAVKGAVSKVFAQGINIKCKVIDNTMPKGICGSGIIDFISVLKKYNALEENGKIKESGHPFSHLVEKEDNETKIYLSGTDVYITENDIRKILISVSSFKSGITALLNKENTNLDEIECLYISGNFGNFIDIENSCNIGLIPSELQNKVKLIGNGALSGATLISLNPSCEDINAEFKTLDLSDDKIFLKEFIKNMKI